MNHHYYVITDGSAVGHGIGAWAAIVLSGNYQYRKLLWGVESHTTIGRCELLPLIAGLRCIRKHRNGLGTSGIRVKLISDSEGTIKAMGSLAESRENMPGSNKDLWAAFLQVVPGFKITARWVERNSHPYMKMADSACTALRMYMKEQAEIIEKMNIPEEEIQF